MQDRITQLCTSLVSAVDNGEFQRIARALQRAIHERVERVRENALEVAFSSYARPRVMDDRVLYERHEPAMREADMPARGTNRSESDLLGDERPPSHQQRNQFVTRTEECRLSDQSG